MSGRLTVAHASECGVDSVSMSSPVARPIFAIAATGGHLITADWPSITNTWGPTAVKGQVSEGGGSKQGVCLAEPGHAAA